MSNDLLSWRETPDGCRWVRRASREITDGVSHMHVGGFFHNQNQRMSPTPTPPYLYGAKRGAVRVKKEILLGVKSYQGPYKKNPAQGPKKFVRAEWLTQWGSSAKKRNRKAPKKEKKEAEQKGIKRKK